MSEVRSKFIAALSIEQLVALILLVVLLSDGLFIMILSYCARSNVIEESVSGTGIADMRGYSKASSDKALAYGATFDYDYKRTWTSPEEQSTESTFTVIGGKGGYRNQYEVKASGAGYKHIYRASQITGDFQGSGVSTVSVETGTSSLDSLVLMAGNATFYGRVQHSDKGKPVTDRELDAIANLTIRSYLQILDVKTNEDWLAFCKNLTAEDLGIIPVAANGTSGGGAVPA